MEKRSRISSDTVLLGLFWLASLAIASTFFTKSVLVLRLVLLLSVPMYAGFSFLRLNTLRLSMAGFLLFAFLGNAFSAIFLHARYVCFANMFYLAALVCLVFALVPKFKIQMKNNNKWLRPYLLGMFAIGLCFLFGIGHIFSMLVLSQVAFYVFVFQAVSLLVLCLLCFGAFLSVPTQSAIWPLVAVICFGFALAVNYISAFYLYHHVFELLGSLFYVLGLYFVFKFMLSEGKTKTKRPIEDCEVVYSEIVFA